MLFQSWVFTSLKIIDELEWSFIYNIFIISKTIWAHIQAWYCSFLFYYPFPFEFKSMPVYGRVSWPTKLSIVYQNFSKIVTLLNNFGPIFKLDIILSLYYYPLDLKVCLIWEVSWPTKIIIPKFYVAITLLHNIISLLHGD